MLLAADDVGAELGPRQHVGRVEHTQFETSLQRLAQVLVEVAFLDESLLQTVGQVHHHLTALQVCAVEHGVDRCRQRILVCLMLAAVEEVVDGIAVGEHDGIVAPLVAKDVDEQTVAGAAGLALEALVGAHHLAHICLLHQSLECRQVGLPQVTVRRLHVHRVAQGFGTAVYGVVLGAGVGLEITVVVALHAEYRLHAEHGVHVRVFAAGLLSASPAWVTEYVDVRAPEGQLRVAGIIGDAHRDVEYIVVGTVPVGTGLV